METVIYPYTLPLLITLPSLFIESQERLPESGDTMWIEGPPI